MKANIILIGMRASGKSTIGKLLAKKLNMGFIDTDSLIEAEAGKSISAIVQEFGWDVFRTLESKVCIAAGNTENNVISAGGGVILQSNNMNALRINSVCVYLETPIKILSDRISGKEKESRPSLTGKDTLQELQEVWEERKGLYERWADIIVSGDEVPEKVVEQCLKRIHEEGLKITEE